MILRKENVVDSTLCQESNKCFCMVQSVTKNKQ